MSIYIHTQYIYAYIGMHVKVDQELWEGRNNLSIIPLSNI